MKQTQYIPWWQWALMFVFSIAVVILSLQFHHRLAHFRSLGLLGILLINFLGSATLFLPAPAIASVVAGGVIYPPLLVAFAASLGATLGDSLGYILGLSGTRIVALRNRWFVFITQLFKKYGAVVVFIFAFVPNPFFDAVGIAAGVLGYPWQKFILWLFLGRLCRNLLLAFFGANLDTIKL